MSPGGQLGRRLAGSAARYALRIVLAEESMRVTSSTTGTHGAESLPPGTIDQGIGEPIVLLHGVLGTPRMWTDVIPRLSAHHRAIALPALGHHGGRRCELRPARIEHIIDDAERSLDALRLDRAHLAGNSMGGWVALELMRRGRALSVCAFSPAGMWNGGSQTGGRSKLRAIVQLTRATRGMLPLTARLGVIRKFGLRDNAVHGDRATPELMVALADAVLACEVAGDLLDTPEQFAPVEVTCPTEIVWSAEDRIFPCATFSATARERTRGAVHSVLEDVGHVPMIDAPDLVANTILRHVASVTAREPIAERGVAAESAS
jgi:pimeloyl-ACP methyl ester carboxylesterase